MGTGEKAKSFFVMLKGKREKRTNLLMAQRGKEWLASLVFTGSCMAKMINMWIETFLLKELQRPSVAITAL